LAVLGRGIGAEATARHASTVAGTRTGGTGPVGNVAFVLDETRDATGALVALEADPARPEHDAAAAAAGLVLTREVLQLRCPLPAADPGPLELRAFRPRVDDEAFLGVNNRAFAWHPDQSGWTAAELRQRETEDWFDPQGFLLHERDGRLAGFCWTKVHPATPEDPALGEIFVIAVDPDFHGLGLGRALTLAGLRHLAGQGLRHGMLHVESTNVPARTLYEDLGFVEHSAHRWWGAADTRR
jgi:mycothiol synthase